MNLVTHLALPLLAVTERQVDNLGELGELDIVQNDQRAVHTLDGRVLPTEKGFHARYRKYVPQYTYI
jgi:hypothetical protein